MIDLVGGLAAFFRILEYVVNQEKTAWHNVFCPELVIPGCRFIGVAPVDEHQAQWRLPAPGRGFRCAHNGDHALFEICL